MNEVSLQGTLHGEVDSTPLTNLRLLYSIIIFSISMMFGKQSCTHVLRWIKYTRAKN